MTATSTAYYDRYWTNEGFQPTGGPIPEVTEFLGANAKPGQRWLDFGCGDGGCCGPAITGLGVDYTGVDVSGPAIDQAQAAGLDARLIEPDARLPFDDDTFDGCVAIEVLEHLFEPQIVARELLRVLRPGGRFYATVPNVAYWRRRVELLLGRFNPIGDDLSIEQPWRDPHIRFFTPSTLERMLAAEGFDPVEAGGHSGVFLEDLPKVGHRFSGKSRAYFALERRSPALFGKRLHVVATKPA